MQPSRWVLLSTFAEPQRLVKRGALCRFCVHSPRANLCSGSSCSQADLCEDTEGVEEKQLLGGRRYRDIMYPAYYKAAALLGGYSTWSRPHVCLAQFEKNVTPGILQVKSLFGLSEL